MAKRTVDVAARALPSNLEAERSVLGAILLLLRRKWAMPVFVVSFLGWLAGAVYAFGMSDGMEAMGPMWPMQIVIGGACVFFIWYAWMMSKKGVLR